MEEGKRGKEGEKEEGRRRKGRRGKEGRRAAPPGGEDGGKGTPREGQEQQQQQEGCQPRAGAALLSKGDPSEPCRAVPGRCPRCLKARGALSAVLQGASD